MEEKIIQNSFDPKSKPFLIKNNKYKNYLICFRQLSCFNIIDYKTMKIIKKINFENNILFQLYKPENKYTFFYVILISPDNSKLEIQKYSSNLSLVKKK